MGKRIIISESDKKHISKLYRLQNESLSDFYKENFEEMLKKMSGIGQNPQDYGKDVEITPENFNQAWDEIKRNGEYYASFGDSGLYVDLVKDYMMGNVSAAILSHYPVIASYSNFKDFKKSKYYLMTDFLFRPNYSGEGSRKQTDDAMEVAFNYAVRSLGDLIIKNPFITKQDEPDKVKYNPHGVVKNLTHPQKSIVLMNLHRLHFDSNLSLHDLDDWRKDLTKESMISARAIAISDEILQQNPKDMEEALKMLEDNHTWKGILDTITDEEVINKYRRKINFLLESHKFNPISLNE